MMDHTNDNSEQAQGVRGEVSRSDMQLISQAARKRWPVSDEQKSKIVQSLMEVMQTSDADRDIVSAARALIAIEKQNQDDDRRPPSVPPSGPSPSNHLHLHLSDDPLAEKKRIAADLLTRLGLPFVVGSGSTHRDTVPVDKRHGSAAQ